MKQYNGTIYSLADKNGNVFYVGCTVLGLERRLAQHVSAAKSNSKSSKYGCPTNRREKIQSLNYEIVAMVLETQIVTAIDAKDASYSLGQLEKKWIGKFLSLGCDLCNGGKRRTRKNRIEKIDAAGDVYTTNKLLPCQQDTSLIS